MQTPPRTTLLSYLKRLVSRIWPSAMEPIKNDKQLQLDSVLDGNDEPQAGTNAMATDEADVLGLTAYGGC